MTNVSKYYLTASSLSQSVRWPPHRVLHYDLRVWAGDGNVTGRHRVTRTWQDRRNSIIRSSRVGRLKFIFWSKSRSHSSLHRFTKRVLHVLHGVRSYRTRNGQSRTRGRRRRFDGKTKRFECSVSRGAFNNAYILIVVTTCRIAGSVGNDGNTTFIHAAHGEITMKISNPARHELTARLGDLVVRTHAAGTESQC